MSTEEILLNTYKVKPEITILAESEDQAKSKISNLLNGNATTDPNARVAGIGEFDVKTEHDNEKRKDKDKRREKLDKLAKDAIKEQRKQGRMKHKWQIPDEMVVVDPDTGEGVLVKTPDKDELEDDTEEGKEEGSSQQGGQQSQSKTQQSSKSSGSGSGREDNTIKANESVKIRKE